jgi:hypothetical protein
MLVVVIVIKNYCIHIAAKAFNYPSLDSSNYSSHSPVDSFDYNHSFLET